jgi:SAM-dependent methyltransferase
LEYEPIKDRLRKMIRHRPVLRKVFYGFLGILFLREWYVKREVRRIFRKNREPAEILDAGCGFGQYGYYCVKRFSQSRVLGLEISESLADDGNRFAQKAGLERLRVEQADITKLDFLDRFDLILNVDVLEHIEQDVELLRRFGLALKTDGCLILSTPTVYRRKKEDSAFVDEHVRDGYSDEDIGQKMKEAGFEIQKITYGYSTWGDLSWRLGIRNTMTCLSHGILGKIFGLLYFVVISPLVFLLMGMDYFWKNARGTGMVVVAGKRLDSHE